MTAGETILKLTDFPFSYSIIGIISGVLGFGISDNYLIFLGIAGAFGTFLAITDPIGWLVRKNAEDRINKGYDNKNNSTQNLEKQYKISALRTKSINFEIEKIIGLFYFIIILVLFLAAVTPPNSLLFEKLIINDSAGQLLCDVLCFKMGYFGVGLAALAILVVKANRFWKNLDEKIMIAGFHQIAINNDNATQTSVESMTRSVEQNDWETAKLWKNKIKEEIKYKKGKREMIIKAADIIYSPLHFESSEFQKHLESMKQAKEFTNFETTQWEKIKHNSLQSIVEDVKLRQRIEKFYKLMKDYNDQTTNLFREMNEIINGKFSEDFGKNVSGVEVHLGSPSSGDVVYLHRCAMSEIHPLEFKSTPEKFGSFKLQVRTGNTVHYSEYTQQNDFDNTWKRVLEDVKNNAVIIKIKKYLTELEIENRKLMKIYSDKIGMQWKV